MDLTSDVVTLTRTLCDEPSPSGSETRLADRVESALRALPHLEVLRDGDTVVARTALGRVRRVVLAGHLDTVPVADNLPVRLEGDGDALELHGRGTVDMKGGVAVQLRLAADLREPRHDLTFVFYDHEEVEASLNGLGRVMRTRPGWITGDFAVLLEPTCALVEGGCKGTLRAEVRLTGVAAHSARAWAGHNAVHDAAEVLQRLRGHEARTVVVDGLEYRECLEAVGIRGGVAGNVVPDECVVTVNYRFAPSLDEAGAEAYVREVFAGFDVRITDSAPGARPGLDDPLAAELVASTGRPATAKQGWTDVARFSALGVPAVNFGPGDPLLAHTVHEHCPARDLTACERALTAWLQG